MQPGAGVESVRAEKHLCKVRDLHTNSRVNSTAVILRGWTASRFKRVVVVVGGGSSMCSSQHLIILTRLAQLRLHKATHRGIFLNAKDAFPVARNACRAMGMRVWRGDRFSTQATVGGLSGDAWPVSPWPVPRAEGQEVAGDPGEDYKPSSVSLYQTTIRYFIQMAGEHKPRRLRAWRDMSERRTSASLSFSCLRRE